MEILENAPIDFRGIYLASMMMIGANCWRFTALAAVGVEACAGAFCAGTGAAEAAATRSELTVKGVVALGALAGCACADWGWRNLDLWCDVWFSVAW